MRKTEIKPRQDVWNPMIKLVNSTKSEEVKSIGKMLLSQYNTAGGRMIKHELEYFLQQNRF
jgi:hypothetical protein